MMFSCLDMYSFILFNDKSQIIAICTVFFSPLFFNCCTKGGKFSNMINEYAGTAPPKGALLDEFR